MEELKKSFDSLGETIDRGFESAEVQARSHFDELIAKIDEMTLAETKRLEEEHRRFDEVTTAIEDGPNSLLESLPHRDKGWDAIGKDPT